MGSARQRVHTQASALSVVEGCAERWAQDCLDEEEAAEESGDPEGAASAGVSAASGWSWVAHRASWRCVDDFSRQLHTRVFSWALSRAQGSQAEAERDGAGGEAAGGAAEQAERPAVSEGGADTGGGAQRQSVSQLDVDMDTAPPEPLATAPPQPSLKPSAQPQHAGLQEAQAVRAYVIRCFEVRPDAAARPP